MSTLRTDNLQTTDSTFSVAVNQLASQASLTGLLATLANSSDPAKGASLIGYNGGTVASALGLLGATVPLKVSNTASQNAALIQTAWLTSNRVMLPKGTFDCAPVFPPTGGSLIGQGPESILRLPSGPSKMLPTGILSGQIGLIHIDSGSPTAFVDGVTISNLQLLGDLVSGGFEEQTHLISLNGARKVTIENVWLTAPQGDAVYCGTGIGGSSERHNFDIVINRCTIDGVNKDNRQALSIVDGVGVWFTNNHVKNTTRSNMPCAVDIEPANAADTTQDIYVLYNLFENIGGTSGVVAYNASHLGVGDNRFTRPSTNFQVIGNTFKDCTNKNGSFAVQVATLAASATTPPHDFLFQSNHTIRGAAICVVVGMRGLRHLDNIYYDCGLGMFLGLQTAGSNYDVVSSRNIYYRVGKDNSVTSGYVMQISSNNQVKIDDDEFVDCGRADGTLGYALYFVDGTSSNVSLRNIVVRNITGKTTYSIKKLVTHTFNVDSNSFTDCVLRVAGNDFAYKAFDYGQFTFATTPAALPVGSFTIAVNDAGFPGTRGLLVSHKYLDPADGSYAATTFQDLIPTPASTGTTKTFLRRKVDPSTGLWQTPVTFTGV